MVSFALVLSKEDSQVVLERLKEDAGPSEARTGDELYSVSVQKKSDKSVQTLR